jgi:hypothetical protein
LADEVQNARGRAGDRFAEIGYWKFSKGQKNARLAGVLRIKLFT